MVRKGQRKRQRGRKRKEILVYSGEVKFCEGCKVEHPIEEFSFRKDTGKYRNQCVKIISEKTKEYREKNKEEITKWIKNYHKENKEEILKQKRDYYYEHKNEYSEYHKNYYNENKEELLIYQAKYCEENQDKIIKYREDNKDKRNDRDKKRKKNDPSFKLRQDLSRTIWELLKINNGSKKGQSVLNNLPYLIQELKQYIENLFEPWMTWENKGSLWHLDHIIPQSYLFYDSMEHPNFKKSWCLKNLRPLEAKRNMSENNRIKPDQDIENMTQEEFETYIEIYLDNYNKQNKKERK